MKRIILTAAITAIALFNAASRDFEFKGNFLWGGTIAQKNYKYDSKKKEGEYIDRYAKNYLLGDAILSDPKITVGGKIYYRIPAMEKKEDISQKMEIKRAFVRFRPFASSIFEISGGKLYSYYLPGNFFPISETYTGASRWGESGVGLKSEWNGWTFGASLPVGETSKTIETETKWDEFFALNGALGYDFSKSAWEVPLKLNGTAGYRRKRTTDTKTNETDVNYDRIAAASVYWTPKLEGFVNKLYATLTYSYNARPFVANPGFTPIINYSDADLKKCHLVSVNYKSYFGPVHFTFEGEAGKSTEGHKVPLYGAAQFLIPFNQVFVIKPRFMYYSAIDTEDGDLTRSSFELYPRIWVTPTKNWNISLGADFLKKQITKDDWKWEWSIPFYIEYKIK